MQLKIIENKQSKHAPHSLCDLEILIIIIFKALSSIQDHIICVYAKMKVAFYIERSFNLLSVFSSSVTGKAIRRQLA